MKTPDILICNCKLITPDRLIEKGGLRVRGNKISDIFTKDIKVQAHEASESGTITINANGAYVAPGFIDIHVHGGGGHDFMDNSPEGFLEIARLHATHGTTSLTPTTLSSEKEDLLETIRIYSQLESSPSNGAEFIGLHIEGPYFAKNQKGAQPEKYIRDPDENEYKEILREFKCIKRWSAAPELEGALSLGRYLAQNGVLPAIAHSDATYDDVVKAVKAGYRHVTHLYCAMSGVTRQNAFRTAGVIESALLLDELTVEIIADGIHLPPALLALVYKVKGPDHIALVTDAMRGAGMPPGQSILGSIKNGVNVIIEDNVAKLPDRSAFAGSVATADQLVRNMIQLAQVPLLDAVKMITATPARIMKMDDRKGKLKEGMDGDIVIFNEAIEIQHTIIGGKLVYSK